jgi:hypothetical protein
MKNNKTRIGLSLILAMLLLAVTVSAVSARRGSPWVGRWQTMDYLSDDTSTNTLNITLRGSGPDYQLVWRETYFSLCDGRPGIGRGTAVEDGAVLHASMIFYCTGKPEPVIYIDFTYNANDTLTTVLYIPGPYPQIWNRIPPP